MMRQLIAVKCPTEDMALTNYVYVAPNTFPNTKYICIMPANKTNAICVVANIAESECIKPNEIATNAFMRRQLGEILLGSLVVSSPLHGVHTIADSVIITVEPIVKGAFVTVNHEHLLNFLNHTMNDMAVNKGQILVYKYQGIKLELKIVCIISDTHHENSHTIIKSDTTKITVTYSQVVKVI
jgi:hypothetical protein